MPQHDSIRVALIGAGFISDYHVAGIRAAGTGEVTTLVGRSRERTAQRAADLGIPGVSADFGAVLEDASIDAVVIATPDATHRPLAVEALAAGKSVMLQKPMAMSSSECREIIGAASASDSRLTVSFMHRYFPEVRWLRGQLHSGAFGAVHGVRLRNATAGAGWADWFFDPHKVAGGVVMQLGVHGIDLLQHLFGPIRSVSARTSTMKPTVRMVDGREATTIFEDNAIALYEFADGFNAVHEMSWTEVAGCDRFLLEVYFEEATVWLRTDRGPAIVAHAPTADVSDWQAVDLAPEPLGKAHHAHWLDIVRGDADPDDTPSAGLSTLIVAEHIYRAARTGNALPVSGC